MTTTLIATSDREPCEKCEGTGQIQWIDQGTKFFYPCGRCSGKGTVTKEGER